ncbi:MAG: cupin domain-containing protein [Rhodospirillales bacterium]|nr:cupin domain-containing protein [Rhodospirillales bacterium]MBO6785765.1 cupin domain-containing protein [Rhodospirillales bacterium]
MTVRHHLTDETLLSYAAGDLDDATSLVVASHLALCPVCRADVDMAEDIGGVMLDDVVPVSMSDDALAHVLARAETSSRDPEQPVEMAASKPAGGYVFPEPLRSRIGGDLASVKWRRIGPGVQQYVLPCRDDASQARLLRIAGGQGVLQHGHTGEEFTLVLAGGFSDGDQAFARGDVEWADQDIVHRPIADDGDGCVCLAVTSGPLQFFDFVGKIVQRFVRI